MAAGLVVSAASLLLAILAPACRLDTVLCLTSGTAADRTDGGFRSVLSATVPEVKHNTGSNLQVGARLGIGNEAQYHCLRWENFFQLP